MGGNVFKDKTTDILKENIIPTLEKYFDELSRVFPNQNISPDNFHSVGSAGKKSSSGDIDLAVDNSVFFQDNFIKEKNLEHWGLSVPDFWEMYKGFKKRARTANVFQVKQKSFNRLLAKKINQESNIILVDEKKSGPGSMFSMFPQYNPRGFPLDINVQIDWMIGNLEWLKFSHYSGNLSGNLKGLHRTQLILAMFAEKGYVFNHTQGVKIKQTNEKVASTPREAIELLNQCYGDLPEIGFNEQNFQDYHKMMKILEKTDEFCDVLDRYLKILDSTRCDVPDDLQDYWIKNKTRLRLHGGYLPEDSTLIPYRR